MDDKKVEEFTRQGNVAFTTKDYQKAIECYSQAIELAPDSHTLYCNRSIAYCTLKKFDEAAEDAHKAIKLNPSSGKGYFRLGQAFKGMTYYKEAYMAFNKALEKEPSNETIQENIADMYQRLMQQHEDEEQHMAKITSAEVNQANATRMDAIFSHELTECVSCLSWSPNGQYLAASSLEGPIDIIDVNTKSVTVTLPGHDFGTADTAFSPASSANSKFGSRYLASCGQDGKACVYDLEQNFKVLCKVKAGSSWVSRILWIQPSNNNSEDSLCFLTVAGKFMKLWSLRGDLIRDYEAHESTITDVQIAKDKKNFKKCSGDLVVTCCYGNVHLFDTNSQFPIRNYSWKGSLISMAANKTAQWVVCGSQDRTIHLWNTRTSQDFQMSGYDKKVESLGFDPSGRWLATNGSGSDILVWDFTAGSGSEDNMDGPAGTMPTILKGHVEQTSCVRYQRKGDVLASGGVSDVFLWSPGNPNGDRALRLGKREGTTAVVQKLSWSPDDTVVAAGYSDGAVMIWNPAL